MTESRKSGELVVVSRLRRIFLNLSKLKENMTTDTDEYDPPFIPTIFFSFFLLLNLNAANALTGINFKFLPAK